MSSASAKGCDRWIGLKAITESGQTLGWSRKIVLDEDDTPVCLILTPVKWLPAIVSGTYELSFDEVVGDKPIRELWVAYGRAEEAIVQRTVGWLELLGFSCHPWEKRPSGVYVVSTSVSEGGDYEEPDSFPCPVPKGPGPAPLAGETEL